MNKKEVRYLPAKELRIVTGADGTKTLTGYAIVFGVRSLDLGGFTEIVAPGAVRDTLSGSPDILMLNNHNSSQVLARTTSGTLKVSTDSVGVKFSCSLDTRSSYANDLAIAVERKDIGGCSFGFRTDKDAWTKEGSTLLRTLQQISISELSVTSSPAYPQTDVSIRSCPSDLRKLLKRDIGDDDDDGECDCDCPECLAGDCADCSDPDCDSEDCEHGEDSARSIDLWRLNMQLAIAQRR
jgi:HK97 family phage prohead protease